MPNDTHVTDELLSAYIDDAVTPGERALVEAAVADDPEVAWRLETLKYTVHLLGRLPEIPLPASFALTEAMVVESIGAPLPAPTPRRPTPRSESGIWQAWRSFWRGGNLLMRNAAAASFAAFLVLSLFGARLSTSQMTGASQLELAPIVSDSSVAPALEADSDPVAQLRPAAGEMMREGIEPMSAPAEPIPLPADAVDEAPDPPMEALAVEEVAAPETAQRSATAQTESEAPAPAAAALADGEEEAATAMVMVASAEMSSAEMSSAEMSSAASVTTPALDVADDSAAESTIIEAVGSAGSPAVAESDAPIATEDAVQDETAGETGASAAVSVADEAAAPIENAPAAESVAAEAVQPSPTPLPTATPAPTPVTATQKAAAPAIAAGPTTSVMQSNPLLLVQIVALGLTALFAALWLVSRRTTSST